MTRDTHISRRDFLYGLGRVTLVGLPVTPGRDSQRHFD